MTSRIEARIAKSSLGSRTAAAARASTPPAAAAKVVAQAEAIRAKKAASPAPRNR